MCLSKLMKQSDNNITQAYQIFRLFLTLQMLNDLLDRPSWGLLLQDILLQEIIS